MTDRNIRVEAIDRTPVEDQEVEIVERKGIGHPDSIADGIAESVSRRLCEAYIDRVGKVLHHNTDETQIVAGTADPAYGGGEMIEPIYILITGRATSEYEGTRIPTERLALEAAREYLGEHVPELDFGTDVIVDVKLGEGSGDLQTVFGEEGKTVPMANDTSFGVGHAPLTETERIVGEAERRLRTEFAADQPAVGPDIKIMGKREDDHVDITVAAAIIDRHVSGLEAYRAVVEEIREYVADLAREHTDRDVTVHVNTADDYDAGSVYLTVTGTSAEQGDDGSVGRGNRVNGLITPNRSMSLEASSGKNPVNHIGKIYNLLGHDIAASVTDSVDGIRDLRIRLLSQIGQPIDQPQVADAHVVTADGVDLADIEDDVAAIIDERLGDVTSITERCIAGELDTF
jgi:S-adenosylmethionine synthetase